MVCHKKLENIRFRLKFRENASIFIIMTLFCCQEQAFFLIPRISDKLIPAATNGPRLVRFQMKIYKYI